MLMYVYIFFVYIYVLIIFGYSLHQAELSRMPSGQPDPEIKMMSGIFAAVGPVL